MILKELDDEITEDTLFKKNSSNNEISTKDKKTNPILLRNINALKNMADKLGVSKMELIRLLKDE